MLTGSVRIRADGVSWREINGVLIALDLESSSYFSTNEAGALMWTALVDGATVAALAGLLCATYGIDQPAAMADATAFIALLDEHGLLEDQP